MFIRGLFDPSISLQVNHVTENLTQLNRVINYEEKKTITKQPSNQPNIQGCIRGGGDESTNTVGFQNQPNISTDHTYQPTKYINPPNTSTNKTYINRPNLSTDQTYQPTKHINRPNISTDQTHQPTKQINPPNTSTHQYINPPNISTPKNISTDPKITQLPNYHLVT